MKLSKKQILKQAEELWEKIKNDKKFPYKSKDEYIQDVLSLYVRVQKDGTGYYERIRDNFIRLLKEQEEIIKLRIERKKMVAEAEKVMLEKEKIDEGIKKSEGKK